MLLRHIEIYSKIIIIRVKEIKGNKLHFAETNDY